MAKEMNIVEEEQYIADEVERAKNRMEILGAHRGPSSKHRGFAKPSKPKTSRMKTFKFKTNLQSWNSFLNKEISFEELRSLQKNGK